MPVTRVYNERFLYKGEAYPPDDMSGKVQCYFCEQAVRDVQEECWKSLKKDVHMQRYVCAGCDGTKAVTDTCITRIPDRAQGDDFYEQFFEGRYTCNTRIWDRDWGEFFYKKLSEAGDELEDDRAGNVHCYFCEEAVRDNDIQEECWKGLKNDGPVQRYVCAGCDALYSEYKALGVSQMSEVGPNAEVTCGLCFRYYEKAEVKKEWFRPPWKGAGTKAVVVCSECVHQYLGLRVMETYETICDTCHTWQPRIRFSKEVWERYSKNERFHMECLRCSGAVAAWGREHIEIIPCTKCVMGAYIGIGGHAAGSSMIRIVMPLIGRGGREKETVHESACMDSCMDSYMRSYMNPLKTATAMATATKNGHGHGH